MVYAWSMLVHICVVKRDGIEKHLYEIRVLDKGN